MKQVTKDTFRIYWQHVRPYRGLVMLLITANFFATVLDVVMPLFYKRFFDVLASEGASAAGVSQLLAIIVQVVLINAVVWVLWRITTFGNNFLQPRVMADLTNTSFEYLHLHSYSFFTNRFAGALVRKVNRFASAFEGIADRLYWEFFPLVIKIVGILGVLFYKNLLLGGVLFVWAAIFMSINYVLTMYKLKYDVESAEMDTKATARLADTITNNVNIKIFSSLKEEIAAFWKLTEEQFRIRRFTWNLGAYIESIQAALTVALEFIIFYVAIKLWQGGSLSVGDFVLIQAYILTTVRRLWDFGRIFRKLYQDLADAEEMTEILSTPHEIIDRRKSEALHVREGKIEFRNVSFRFIDGQNVIKNLNIVIQPGEKVGLIGPSGAGKTTLVALLLRFHDLQEGNILVDDIDICMVTQDSLRENIAFVPQDPILFHRTLMENIRYGRMNATDKEVHEAARLAHCDEFIERFPEKYGTFVGERGIKLSGGERQRIAIARAILKNAPILILDEATSSLDSHSEALIQDALTNLMKGKTAIVIAHRLSTIMKMDRIIVMREGAMIEEGTHISLLKQSESLYKQLWELQAGGFIA